METNRRDALIRLLRLGGAGAAASGVGVWLARRSRRPEQSGGIAVRKDHAVAADPELPEMVIVQGDDPRQLARRAIAELGGIRRFVARGDVVVVKPNMAWDRTPQQAANTNPGVIAEVVRLCREAEARRVVVADVAINEARRVAARSGIAEAAREAGAEILLPEPRFFREVDLRGDVLGVWPVLQPFLEADKIINIPIAKHHSLTGATLGMKNWYGILGGARHRLHQRIHESLADLADFARPTLTILDAYRVLLRNGPSGGNLQDVVLKKTLIAGVDPVALDAYAAKAFWDLSLDQLAYLNLARERGLGTPRFETLRTRAVMV
jgi:uncharacterized protein (DUF362 family)